MKKEEVQYYSGFVKTVSYVLKQFRLYSEKHPIAQQALRTLSSELDIFFSKKKRVTLGSMRKLLVVDGDIVSEKDSAARDLAGELDRLGLEGLTLEQGLDIAELTRFLLLMAMRSKNIDEKGGFRKIFADQQKDYAHIRLTAGKYELVEEGQSVQEGGKPAAKTEETRGDVAPAVAPQAPLPPAAAPIAGIADIINRIRKGDDPKQQPLSLDCEKIVVQIEKNPEEVARLALENTQNPELLEPVIRKIVHFLIEGLIGYLVEQGRDITKALQKLSKELEKAVERSVEGPEVAKLKERIPMIFEEAADELRIQMMLRTVKKDPADVKSFHKMAQKLFKDEKVRSRLAPALTRELGDAGVPAERLEEAFGKIEEKEEKKRSRVTVDAEELARLKELAKSAGKGGKKGAGGGGTGTGTGTGTGSGTGGSGTGTGSGTGSGGADVSPDELDTLRKKAVLYDALEDKFKKTEVEKKRITDEKERVDAVIRNLAEGLLVVDKEGKVVLMNPAAERLLGVKKTDKLGKKVTENLKEGQMVAMASGNNLKDSGGVAKNVEVVSLDDESKRVLQASTAVIENEDGKTVGMVSVLSDVTKQKEIEELKTKFVANVSHELRTPLVAIQKSLSLILGNDLGEVNPEQRRFLDIASRNIERLSRLINDLLDISKIEAGAMKLQCQKIEVRLLAFHITSTLETWTKDKKIQFKIDVPESGLVLEGDSDRLTQVLTNLAGNAIKFTPEGGTITIGAKMVKDDKGEDFVEIGVSDTGIGIAPEDCAKIFDKFVQVSLAQPSGVSSTGLGLTIAREIVEMHSGKIWVESEPGKGSRFVFRVPAKFKPAEQKKLGPSA